MMKATVFLICATVMLVSGQAPNDIDESCRTAHPNNVHHDWIPYVNDTAVGVRGSIKWQVLLDQFDYQTLFPSLLTQGVWTAVDFDNDGFQFTQSGTTCTNILRTPSNSYENPNTNHWVFTQAVSYLDAVEVIVNATVRFAGCVQLLPDCVNSFVTLHRFDTNSTRNENEVTNTDNYQPYLGDPVRSRLEQTSDSGDVEIIQSFDRPNADLTYFGIQDTGTRGEVTRIIVYYRVAQGYEEELVVCPNVGLPRSGSSDTNSGRCTCKSNATPLTDMTRVCDGDGVCQENPSCACNPGYEYDSTAMECRACPVGEYKADISNGQCRTCPVNSTTITTSSTVCECRYGTVRNLSQPDDACQALDDFVRDAASDLFRQAGSCEALDDFLQSAVGYLTQPDGSCQNIGGFIQTYGRSEFSHATISTAAMNLVTVTALAVLYGLNFLH